MTKKKIVPPVTARGVEATHTPHGFTLHWFPEDLAEVTAAEEVYKKLWADGHVVHRLLKSGLPGARLDPHLFSPNLGKCIAVKQAPRFENGCGQDLLLALSESKDVVKLVAVDSAQFKFRLGNLTFEVEEDASDGYRSSLKEVQVFNKGDKGFLKQNLLPIDVQVRVSAVDDDIWEVFEPTNPEHPLLRVGTDHSDDYYPQFVFSYVPPPSKRERLFARLKEPPSD